MNIDRTTQPPLSHPDFVSPSLVHPKLTGLCALGDDLRLDRAGSRVEDVVRGNDTAGEGDLEGTGLLVGRVACVVACACHVDGSNDAIGPSNNECTVRAVRQRHMSYSGEEDDQPRREQGHEHTNFINLY